MDKVAEGTQLTATAIGEAPEVKVEDTVVFEHREFDVQNTCENCCACFTASSQLVLEPNEVFLIKKNCCGTTKKRLPYGELGSVDEITACGCCAAFNAGSLAAAGPNGEAGAIQPGCGCSKELVSEIVEELNQRQRHRGDTAKMKMAEEQGSVLFLVSHGMPLHQHLRFFIVFASDHAFFFFFSLAKPELSSVPQPKH
jgi:hypothetical protein